jgi:hypothetical protein
MVKVVIELSPTTYQQLRQRAAQCGQAPESLASELLEAALQATQGQPPPEAVGASSAERQAVTDSASSPPVRSTREILRASGMLSELSPYLRSKIIPGVTLEEVREALTRAEGPSLSEIILEQRGPKE